MRFVGSLVNAGCDPALLRRMLETLERPYSYDINRIYFDWLAGRWRLLPERTVNAEAVFHEWIEQLKEEGDVDTLTSMEDDIARALAAIQPSSE